MSDTEKDKHLNYLRYFHEEKGDMRRYCKFEEAIKYFPHIEHALADYEYYKEVLDVVVMRLPDNGL